MLKPASKKQAVIFAVIWTALVIYYFIRLFQSSSDWFHIFMVIACAVNAGGWWTNYAKKQQAENNRK